jgi:excisionase family DNA binding protein
VIDPDGVYTTEQVAKHWQTSGETVRRMLTSGTLRGFRVGDHWRVTGRAMLEHQGDPVPAIEDDEVAA